MVYHLVQTTKALTFLSCCRVRIKPLPISEKWVLGHLIPTGETPQPDTSNDGRRKGTRQGFPSPIREWSFLPPKESTTIGQDRKSTRLNSSHVRISYAVFCLKKKNNTTPSTTSQQSKTTTHQ